MSPGWRRLLVMMFGIVGLLPAVANAQAVGGDNSAAADGPTLACTTVAMPIMAPEVTGSRFVCQIVGAQSSDTAFIVRASAGPQAAPTPGESSCTGTLAGGAGVCLGSSIDRSGGALGQLSFVATLQPSGSTLGPVALESSSAQPQPQPRDFSAPPAPINYFPLP